MKTVEFRFSVPKCLTRVLELHDGEPTELILGGHLAEWWFGKTHHAALEMRGEKYARDALKVTSGEKPYLPEVKRKE